jgi:transposase
MPERRTRFRCGNCGNLTRFDVYETRRIRAYHHFSLGGDLCVDEEEVLEADRERVTCRWCGSSDAIEELPVELGQPPAEEPDRQP